jgi:site-specific recombinase
MLHPNAKESDSPLYSENETMVRKAKPICILLVRTIKRAHFAEDPVDIFIKQLKSQNFDMEATRTVLQKVLPSFDYTWFFTQVGLSHGLSLFAETLKRLEEKFLPPLLHPNEVVWILNRLFSADDIKVLARLSPHQLYRLVCFFSPQEEVDELSVHFVEKLKNSVEILSQKIAGHGLDALIARKFITRPELAEPFLQLGRLASKDSPQFSKEHGTQVLQVIKNCQESLDYIQSRREEEGTSLVLTYRLFQIEDLLNRLRGLVLALRAEAPADMIKHISPLVFKIMETHNERAKIGDFFTRNIEILAYQVTLLTGRTGEHYISSNTQELKNMWLKAIKGAFIVAVMVLIKMMASKLFLAPLPEAVLYGSIYAIGFVVLHQVGGVLATKQPAMTASTIAAAMDNAENSTVALHNLSDAIIRTLRTQIAALLGNYLFAFPIALLLVFPLLIFDHPFISFEKAHHIVEDHHPYLSLSFLYAAIAGVCLFLSGLISGLADNWFDYNQIATRLKTLFSSARAEKRIDILKKNFGIWTGNILLGFMLGSMYSMGRIVGLPLDIRHVTFASGAFGVAWIHQDEMLPWPGFFLIAGTIFIIGIINLAVSFSLSLIVAMKSRKLHFVSGRKLFIMVGMRILRSPGDLLFHREKQK